MLHSSAAIGIFQSGLHKARKQLCKEILAFTFEMISNDGKLVPAHMRDWKIGSTFSWHYVKTVEYRTAQLSQTIEDIMPKPTKKKRGSGNDFEKYAFVRCELRSEDKKAAKVWIEENTAELGSLLHDAIASGNKFSVTFSSEHDTFTACFTGKPDESINEYKTITARHKDWVVASLTLLYKTNVMFKNGVWETDDEGDDDGWA